MATNPNNAANAGGNNNGNNNDSTDLGARVAGSTPETDPVFAKHIDMAIEAQDGKAPAQDTDTSSGEKKPDAKGKEEQPKDSTGNASDDKSQPKPAKEGKEGKGNTGGAKDLTLADGSVIKGGAERRFYEQRETARQEAQHYKTVAERHQRDAQTAQQQLQQLQQTVQSVNGAAPQDVAIGVRMVTDLKRDPVGTVKKLLAECLAAGHTIENIGAGVDTLAIQRMIDERVPLQTQDAGPTEEQIIADATAEANEFFNTYPDAKPHDGLLARMLNDNPTASLSSAYFDLKSAFAERGFDWSLSLEDNLRQSNQDNNGQQQNNQTAPLPNGGNAANGQQAAPIKSSAIAHEDTDMSDIVREAMRENGLNV